MPALEIDHMRVRRGRLPSTCSTGQVICRSTSSGPRPGAMVLTCTCTGVVSGKASMVSCDTDQRPSAANASAAATTTKRWCSDQVMMALSMAINHPPGCGP
jgi:hypothetical protein